MTLINAKPEVKFDKICFKIPNDLFAEIKQYCEAFGIKTLDNFFSEVAQYVLKSDRD